MTCRSAPHSSYLELLARTDSFVPPLPLAGGRLAAACPRLLPPGLIHPTAPLIVHPSKCSNARLRPAIRNNILSATDINDAHVSMRQGTLANYMC